MTDFTRLPLAHGAFVGYTLSKDYKIMNKRGQSIIEYVLIAFLVILGIVFMGPYVLRSINGHFKLWDEGVQDSFQENITQAPVNDVPPINIDCQCTPYNANCGGTGLLCPANEREVDFQCTTPGCGGVEAQSYCINDSTCCSTAVDKGCGNYPLSATAPSETPCPTFASGVAHGSTCYSSPDGINCPYGYQIWGYACGTNNSNVCIPDQQSSTNQQGCPPPTCTGFSVYQNAFNYCLTQSPTPPPPYPATPALTQNTSVYYIGNDYSDCANTTADGPCRVYCVPPYTLAGNACVLQFTVASTSCTATTNFSNTDKDKSCSASSTGPCCGSKVGPGPGGNGATSTVTTNNQSFTIQANPSTVITSVTVLPVLPIVKPTPGIGGEYDYGCGNPGEPTQNCSVTINN